MSLAQNLINLYQADRLVRALRVRLTSAEQTLRAAKTAEINADVRTRELKLQVNQLRATASGIDVESRSIQDRIDKHRGELNLSTNMRQYEALLSEMKLLQDKRSELDDQALGLLMKADQLETERVTAQATQTDRHARTETAEVELAARATDIGDRLSELERKRAEAAAHVPEAELARFNALSEATDGEAMAEVIEIDVKRREYACGECHIELPSSIYAAVASNPNAIAQCTSCRRILYIAGTLATATAS
ncbi:MAG: C4-type zinc ribbon domain-containing protein [Planctomycetota bacterium]|nr:C4-type zinc ribbon domain-containing protein [Planctomycetota bacterium]